MFAVPKIHLWRSHNLTMIERPEIWKMQEDRCGLRRKKSRNKMCSRHKIVLHRLRFDSMIDSSDIGEESNWAWFRPFLTIYWNKYLENSLTAAMVQQGQKNEERIRRKRVWRMDCGCGLQEIDMEELSNWHRRAVSQLGKEKDWHYSTEAYYLCILCVWNLFLYQVGSNNEITARKNSFLVKGTWFSTFSLSARNTYQLTEYYVD